jgi:hypothetical protein
VAVDERNEDPLRSKESLAQIEPEVARKEAPHLLGSPSLAGEGKVEALQEKSTVGKETIGGNVATMEVRTSSTMVGGEFGNGVRMSRGPRPRVTLKHRIQPKFPEGHFRVVVDQALCSLVGHR